MEHTKKERKEYNLRRDKTCKALGITKNQYNAFRRLGEELRKTYAADCNGDLASSEALDAAVSPLYARGDTLAASLKLHIFYQTDPRGATVYLDKVLIPENNYTRAYCIA